MLLTLTRSFTHTAYQDAAAQHTGTHASPQTQAGSSQQSLQHRTSSLQKSTQSASEVTKIGPAACEALSVLLRALSCSTQHRGAAARSVPLDGEDQSAASTPLDRGREQLQQLVHDVIDATAEPLVSQCFPELNAAHAWSRKNDMSRCFVWLAGKARCHCSTPGFCQKVSILELCVTVCECASMHFPTCPYPSPLP